MVRDKAHLEEVLVHARRGRGHKARLHVIQRVHYAGVGLPKAELIDCVAEINDHVSEWRHIMYVHVALLVRPPRGEVEVSCYLVNLPGTRYTGGRRGNV